VGFSIGFGHVGFFYDELRPYGDWIEFEPGFYAWRPIRMTAGWRPYFHGRWIWTDYGWYWHSTEPFGWIVFHYGRWFYDDYYGWIWIPDDVWGPGWVEWRYHDDYIGWAPLPPYAVFRHRVGIHFTTHWVAPVRYWCFIRYRHFAASDVGRYAVHESSTRRLIRTSRSVVRYETENDRLINRGVDRSIVERRGRIRVEEAEVRGGAQRNERMIREEGRQRIEVYRPTQTELGRRPERIDARTPDRRTTLDLRSVERSRPREEIDRTPERTPQRTPERAVPDVDRRRGEGERTVAPQERPSSPERPPQESWRVRPGTQRPQEQRESGVRPESRTDREVRPVPSEQPRARPTPERRTREQQTPPSVREQPKRERPSPPQRSRTEPERPRRY
jgi:hypothetical protein